MLQSGQSEVAVQDIRAIGGFDGQEAPVISGSSLIPLLHFNVRGSGWNCDDIMIAGSAGKKNREKNLSVTGYLCYLA